MRKPHGLARIDGGQQDSQHVLRAAQAGQRCCRRDRDAGVGRVDVDAGGAQLEQCALGGGDELGRLPQLGGDGDGGGLVGGQLDGGQGVGVAVDAVALGGVELRHAAGFERDAQVAQLVLVALEHAGECFVAGAVGVAVDGFADALGGDEGAGGQQRDHEVHQPLDFGNPHS